MTRALLFGLVAALTVGSAVAVHAQPADLPIAAATTDKFPPGVRVRRLAGGAVYVSQSGQTLYGLDMRTVLRAGADPAQYCTGHCADEWTPLLAPAGASPNINFPGGFDNSPPPPGFFPPRTAPDWTIIQGAAGPQWVYKGWHLVFVHKGDKPGSTAFDGQDNLTWNTLKFIPPAPKIVAPGNVRPVWFEGAYVLADEQGRPLFSGKCAGDCTQWDKFTGGMASADIGKWHVDTRGDQPQWLYRGAPVFIASNDRTIPEGGKALQP